MPFLFQIYVEKNLPGENLCGEKMTNMSSGWSHSALAQSQAAGTPCIFFWSFLTKTKPDEAFPSHVHSKN